MSRTLPQLDAPIAPFRLISVEGGQPVAIDELIDSGPAVLALVEDAPVDDPRASMLRELGGLMRGSSSELVVVSPGDSSLARTLAGEAAARWLTDPRGEASQALGLVEARKLRKKRKRDGLFVVDQQRVLRFAFVAVEQGQWIPASFVSSRLSRLGAAAVTETAEVHRRTSEQTVGEGEVESLVRVLGQAMGLVGTELTQLGTACRFRDLGMAAIPDEIITKSEPLTDEEWAIVRTHPLRSADMLGPSPLFEKVRAIVRATHEHFDGSGYPDGIAGEAIPLGARIILVAESYVSLHARPDVDDALAELRTGAATMFDPRVLSMLESVLGANGAAAQTTCGD
jgi:response regulator RpfG family c-di-GMP phosphodiesterase